MIFKQIEKGRLKVATDITFDYVYYIQDKRDISHDGLDTLYDIERLRFTDGDIEIVYRGLGSGEKLHEELLIDGESQKTAHPLIYKAIEKSLDLNNLQDKLNTLETYLRNNEIKKTIKILNEIVPEWSTN